MFTTIPAAPLPVASRITYIDGDEGILLIAGFPSNGSRSTAISSDRLSLLGELRRRPEGPTSTFIVTRHTMVRADEPIIASGATSMGHDGLRRRALGVRHDSTDIRSDPRMITCPRDPVPTMAATANVFDRPAFVYPKNELDYATNFLACALRCRARTTSPTPSSPARWTASSSCTPTTSGTPRPRRCGLRPSRPTLRLHRGGLAYLGAHTAA